MQVSPFNFGGGTVSVLEHVWEYSLLIFLLQPVRYEYTRTSNLIFEGCEEEIRNATRNYGKKETFAFSSSIIASNFVK